MRIGSSRTFFYRDAMHLVILCCNLPANIQTQQHSTQMYQTSTIHNSITRIVFVLPTQNYPHISLSYPYTQLPTHFPILPTHNYPHISPSYPHKITRTCLCPTHTQLPTRFSILPIHNYPHISPSYHTQLLTHFRILPINNYPIVPVLPIHNYQHMSLSYPHTITLTCPCLTHTQLPSHG